jgi:hypothetical protein
MLNSTYIKHNYKDSTIARMKLVFGFKTLKSINDSVEVSKALEFVQRQQRVFRKHIQEELFDLIDMEMKSTDVKNFVKTLK